MLGTLLGAVVPCVFGLLIESGSRDQVMLGDLPGAGLMILAAMVTALVGIPLSWT